MLDSTSGRSRVRDAAVGAGMLFLMTTAVATSFALQAPDGSIAGLVSDAETGAPVAQAIISVAGATLTSVSEIDGSYRLSGLSAGPNDVMVARAHYYPHTFRAIVPARGTLRIDIALHPAPTNLPGIEVRAPLPVRGVEGDDWAVSADRRVSAAEVRADPRLSEADPLEALSGGEVTVLPESPEGLHVLGGASDQVAYRLDGVPVFSPYHGAGAFSAWNPDALSHLDLITGAGAGDGLSGTVSAATISPTARAETRGSLSSTQARSTLEGPIGWAHAGFLISLRSAFPGLLGHRRESSYVEGESSDWLMKLESPLAGGRLRVLGYGSNNAISAVRTLTPADSVGEPGRNQFHWEGRSFGGDWSRQVGKASVDVRLWSATAGAGADWSSAPLSSDRLDARRRDEGLEARIDVGGPGNHTSFRARGGRSATFYWIRRLGDEGADVPLDLAAPLWTVGLTHEKSITARTALVLDLGAEAWGGEFRVDPGAEFRWRLAENIAVSAGYSRRHQFVQSLRNEESVVGSIFPADLFVGAGPGGVPVARSDLSVVTLRYRPGDRIRLTGRAYLRSLGGLALNSPRSDGPFAKPAGLVVGSGTATGMAIEAATAGPRYGLLLTYGLERLHLQYADTSYVPGFGVTHSLEAGARFMPSPGTSLNVGVTALFGRHGTAVTGPFEWEGCNLLDRGCEFAGSPRQAPGVPGLLLLPAYLRLDLGIRKRWDLRVGHRDVELALFGTLTNVLGRQNIMTEVIDPTTGSRRQVEMRPRSPLTVGLDWRY